MQYISCLSNRVKDKIINDLREQNISDEGLEDFIARLPDCETGAPAEVKEIKTGGGKGTRKKRAPSAYNLFIGKCMKSGEKIKQFSDAASKMKQCALEWKKQKSS